MTDAPSALSNDVAIKTMPWPKCISCGNEGVERYSGMVDRLFGVEGRWRLVQCANSDCRLLWQNPMPRPEDIHKAYRDYFTHDDLPRDSLLKRIYREIRRGYLSRQFGYTLPSTTVWQRILGMMAGLVPELRARFDFAVMWLPAKEGGCLLEVGCGRGDSLETLSELGWKTEGIDFDARAVSLAHARGINVRQGSLDAQNYSESMFDAIIMSHVIEHLHHTSASIRECHRILKPGGRLVLLTPNTDSLGHKMLGRHWLHLDPPRHLHLFNATNLQKLFDGVGFRTIKCFSVIRDADWTLGASLQIRRKGLYKMGKLPAILRIAGKLLMYFEWLGMLVFPHLGEEIVIIAEK